MSIDVTEVAKKIYGINVLLLHLYVLLYLHILDDNATIQYAWFVVVQVIWYFLVVYLGVKINKRARDRTFLLLAWAIPFVAYIYARSKGYLTSGQAHHR